MDLDNLNIVSIAPPRASKPIVTKRRRNNKYERRRRKAEQAIRNNQGTKTFERSIQEQDDDTSVRSTEPESDKTLTTKALEQSGLLQDEAKLILVKDEQLNLSKSKRQRRLIKDADANEPNTSTSSTKKDKEDSSIPPSKTNIESEKHEEDENGENDDKGNEDDNDEEDEDERSPTTPIPSSRRKPTQLPKDHGSREDYAEYLVKFHARPLELDRRAGAFRLQSTPKSMESTHIFATVQDKDCIANETKNEDRKTHDDDDSNNNSSATNSPRSLWERLSLHPRLVRTLTNQFGLTRPTTVQYQALQALVNGSHRSMDSKMEPSNVLIHSETGSGKTLAYALPILQSLVDKYITPNSNNDETLQICRPSRQEMGVQCIIVCPTRDLALQTLQVWKRLCAHSFGWFVPGGLIGSGSHGKTGMASTVKDTRQSEKASIRKGLAIIVATPGRLLDHLSKTESLVSNLQKGTFQWLVLDEADQLLEDRGERELVKQIVQRVQAATTASRTLSSSRARTVLVSATASASLQALAKEVVCREDEAAKKMPLVLVKGNMDHDNKLLHEVQSANFLDENAVSTSRDAQQGEDFNDDNPQSSSSFLLSESTPRQLVQLHLTVNAKLRLTTLIALLVERVKQQDRTIVFLDTRASVDYHYKLFQKMESIVPSKSTDSGVKTTTIFGSHSKLYKLHGNMTLVERQKVLQEFTSPKNSSSSILLATDVAARGLDLAGIDWIVQYDPPCQVTDYVHRVGRVARAGRAGHALLFLLPSEGSFLDVLVKRGMPSKNLTAVSLASTLNSAAQTCKMDGSSSNTHKAIASSRCTIDKGTRMGESFCSELQKRLEDCVEATKPKKTNSSRASKSKRRKQSFTKHREEQRQQQGEEAGESTELFALAREAFLSHIRAYPTKEKSIRTIFSARALHLGHVARSFALKEPPKSLVSSMQQNPSKQTLGKRKEQDEVEEAKKVSKVHLFNRETFNFQI